MNRRQLLTTSVCGIASTLSGCFTSRLHQDPTYLETVEGIFISNDKKTVAVIGKKYHYIFDAPPQLLAALSPSLHPAIAHAGFDSFKVDSQNKIKGTLNLYTSENMSTEEVSLATQAGFGPDRGKRWSARLPMKGARYVGQDIGSTNIQRLNKNYTLTITEEPSLARSALNIAATPITVAADGAAALGVVALSPLWLPIVASGPCFFCAK